MPKTLDDIAKERGQELGLVIDMDRISRDFGGPGIVESYEKSVCAGCGKRVDERADFRDQLSREEWRISRSCQTCQDVLFDDSDTDVYEAREAGEWYSSNDDEAAF